MLHAGNFTRPLFCQKKRARGMSLDHGVVEILKRRFVYRQNSFIISGTLTSVAHKCFEHFEKLQKSLIISGALSKGTVCEIFYGVVELSYPSFWQQKERSPPIKWWINFFISPRPPRGLFSRCPLKWSSTSFKWVVHYYVFESKRFC